MLRDEAGDDAQAPCACPRPAASPPTLRTARQGWGLQQGQGCPPGAMRGHLVCLNHPARPPPKG